MTAVILPFRSPAEIEHAAAAKELASVSPVARTFAGKRSVKGTSRRSPIGPMIGAWRTAQTRCPPTA